MAKVTCARFTFAQIASGGNGSAVVYEDGVMLDDYLAKVDITEDRTSDDEYADGNKIDNEAIATGAHMALELVNNGPAFQGADGVIVTGATFYLVANMIPKDSPNYTSGSLDQIFIKDRYTSVGITITSLATATYGLPNLEIPHPTVGLSVNLNWEEGLWFDEIPL